MQSLRQCRAGGMIEFRETSGTHHFPSGIFAACVVCGSKIFIRKPRRFLRIFCDSYFIILF